jgi:hypothetical protein
MNDMFLRKPQLNDGVEAKIFRMLSENGQGACKTGANAPPALRILFGFSTHGEIIDTETVSAHFIGKWSGFYTRTAMRAVSQIGSVNTFVLNSSMKIRTVLYLN